MSFYHLLSHQWTFFKCQEVLAKIVVVKPFFFWFSFVYLPVVAQIGQRPCSAVTGGKFVPFCIRTALWSGASTREIRSLWDGWSWKRRRNWSASDLDRCGRCRPFLKAVAMTTSSASQAPENSITSSPPVHKNSCNSALFFFYSFGLHLIRLKIST